MATLSVLRVMLIAVVGFYALLYHGSCTSNEAKAETKKLATDPPSNTLRVNLIRRDWRISPLLAGPNFSNAERLSRAIERSHNRQRRLQHSTSPKNESFYSPITAGDGEFLMQMAIGSPVPLNLHFILDTGSDLIWTQCQPCGDSCIIQNDPIYNPSESSSYSNVSCSSQFCLAFNASNKCDYACGVCDNRENCLYNYVYADFSYTAGVLGYETFSLETAASSTRTSFLNLTFGCGREQGGPSTATFSYSAGIIGFGRGPLSLVSQIGSSINNIFSYCLGSIYNASQISPLFLGRVATLGAGYRATPLVQNKAISTFYYLSLRGISVAGIAVRIPKGSFEILPNGTGGFIIDSGTTLTYLVDPPYNSFLSAVRSSIQAPPAYSSAISLDLCYNAKSDLLLPNITFEFKGGAKYALPPENSFVTIAEYGLVCLAFERADSLSIFGNVQQQNFHIVYDLRQNKLHFAPTNCAKS